MPNPTVWPTDTVSLFHLHLVIVVIFAQWQQHQLMVIVWHSLTGHFSSISPVKMSISSSHVRRGARTHTLLLLSIFWQTFSSPKSVVFEAKRSDCWLSACLRWHCTPHTHCYTFAMLFWPKNCTKTYSKFKCLLLQTSDMPKRQTND